MSVHVKWMDQALCANQDPGLFFNDTLTGRAARMEKAKALCAQCPVIEECEEHAKGDRYGVWAGRLMSSRTKRERVPAPIVHGTNGGYRTHQRRGIPACWECREAARLYRQNYDAQKRSA